jgi:hypothetical protein
MKTEDKPATFLVGLGMYAAWLATSILVIFDALYFREAVLSIFNRFQAAQDIVYHQKGGLGLDFSTGFALLMWDEIMLLLLGIAAIATVVGVEYYFRKGQPKNLLLKRVLKVFGIEIGIIVVSIIIRIILIY